jgi:hypothetical protein
MTPYQYAIEAVPEGSGPFSVEMVRNIVERQVERAVEEAQAAWACRHRMQGKLNVEMGIRSLSGTQFGLSNLVERA